MVPSLSTQVIFATILSLFLFGIIRLLNFRSLPSSHNSLKFSGESTTYEYLDNVKYKEMRGGKLI